MTPEDIIKKNLMIRAINEQADRYEQERGPFSKTKYNEEWLPRGRNDQLNEKIIVPALLNEFKDPEDLILESERYFEANPGRQKYAPEVRDPKTIQDILYPKRMS